MWITFLYMCYSLKSVKLSSSNAIYNLEKHKNFIPSQWIKLLSSSIFLATWRVRHDARQFCLLMNAAWPNFGKTLPHQQLSLIAAKFVKSGNPLFFLQKKCFLRQILYQYDNKRSGISNKTKFSKISEQQTTKVATFSKLRDYRQGFQNANMETSKHLINMSDHRYSLMKIKDLIWKL